MLVFTRPSLSLTKSMHSYPNTSTSNHHILLLQYGLMWQSAAFKLMEDKGRVRDAPSVCPHSRRMTNMRSLVCPQGVCRAPSVLLAQKRR